MWKWTVVLSTNEDTFKVWKKCVDLSGVVQVTNRNLHGNCWQLHAMAGCKLGACYSLSQARWCSTTQNQHAHACKTVTAKRKSVGHMCSRFAVSVYFVKLAWVPRTWVVDCIAAKQIRVCTEHSFFSSVHFERRKNYWTVHNRWYWELGSERIM